MAARREAATEAARDVLITRDFDAPRDLVFRAWTDPDRLARWHAPRGCTIEYRAIDVRPGGSFHSCIRTPDGQECWCVGTYLEVDEPGRIVYTLALSDEDGGPVDPADASKDPDWPRETTVTVTLEDLGGRTRLTLHQTVSEDLAKRTGAHPSWLQMLDLLAEDLATAPAR
jgi:uncharacterized protein YndB with AHSA1/START domain